MSRAEVARRLALSPSALTKVTKPFIETGYLREQLTGEGPSTVGRPSQPLQVDASRMSFVGIKLTADELSPYAPTWPPPSRRRPKGR